MLVPTTNKQTNNFIHSYCCAASVASEQQHKQDLRKYIEEETNSRIDHFLPECIAFNQTALRHF